MPGTLQRATVEGVTVEIAEVAGVGGVGTERVSIREFTIVVLPNGVYGTPGLLLFGESCNETIKPG